MTERIRDVISQQLTLQYFHQRIAAGWAVAAVEWVKPSATAEEPIPESAPLEEVPYGQRIAKDCGHLTDDPYEMTVLVLIYEKVVSGWRPTQIAGHLNNHGLRARGSSSWTAAAVFDLLPRLIELSPKLQSRPDWPARRAKLEVLA